MGFTTRNYSETTSGFIWEVDWDGSALSAPLRNQAASWEMAVQLATRPAATGGTELLGVELTARHLRGPHPEDWDPAGQATLRLPLLDTLSDIGTVQRGDDVARHSLTTGGRHDDSYRVETFRLVQQGGVTIRLIGNHTQIQVAGTGTSGTGAGAGTTGTTTGGTVPPATPPGGRTSRGFKFVEKTPHDENGGVWVGGALTFGETDVGSVDEMVDHILNTLGPDECIGSITIVAHGCPGNISVGNGDRGTEPGKEISICNLEAVRATLLRLRCRFCPDSKVYLSGCNVGAGEEGARLLFELKEIFQCVGSVEAPTGACNPFFDEGDTQRVGRDDAAPPPPLKTPDEIKAEKKKAVKKLLFGGTRGSQPVRFEAGAIRSARWLPRLPGLAFQPELATSGDVRPVDKRLLMLLRSELASAGLGGVPFGRFALDGCLALEITIEGKRLWLPPWGVVGGGRALAPLLGDTQLLYMPTGALRDALVALVQRSRYGE